MNESLFLIINGWRSPAIDRWMQWGTQLGDFWNFAWIFGISILLFLVAPLGERRGLGRFLPRRKALTDFIVMLMVGYVLAGLLVLALKVMFHLPRPIEVLPAGTVHLLATNESPFRFPSSHAAFMALLVVALWRHVGWAMRSVLLALLLYVGLSRVNLGLHFPADVLAGYLVGAVSAAVGAWIRSMPKGMTPPGETQLPRSEGPHSSLGDSRRWW